MDRLIGTSFGPYRILEQIGEGGMGVVYRGYQESLNRYVAIKVLRGELARNQEFIARFGQEARAVARLSHPNILHVYDAGVVEGRQYMAMDYAEGGSVKDLLQRGPIQAERAVSLAAQVADALDQAHQHGLVHRDVKPGNILLARDGRPLLTDFGIARALDASTRLTRTGASIGTPEYMSPEQGLAEPTDGRTDIYALGIVLYEMLTGHVPFHTETPMATLYKQVHEPPPPLRRNDAELPSWLEKVVAKALSKRPADRFQTASEFAAALRQGKESRAALGLTPRPATPTPAIRRTRRNPVPLLVAMIGALLFLLIGVGLYLALSGSEGGRTRSRAAPVRDHGRHPAAGGYASCHVSAHRHVGVASHRDAHGASHREGDHKPGTGRGRHSPADDDAPSDRYSACGHGPNRYGGRHRGASPNSSFHKGAGADRQAKGYLSRLVRKAAAGEGDSARRKPHWRGP